MSRIEVIGNAITREEQLKIAKLLIKNGYTVNIEKGESVNRKSRSFINFKRESEADRQ